MTHLEKAAQELEKEASRLEAWIKEQSPTYRQIEDQGATMQTVRAYRKAAQFFREKVAKQIEQEITQALTHPGKTEGE